NSTCGASVVTIFPPLGPGIGWAANATAAASSANEVGTNLRMAFIGSKGCRDSGKRDRGMGCRDDDCQEDESGYSFHDDMLRFRPRVAYDLPSGPSPPRHTAWAAARA